MKKIRTVIALLLIMVASSTTVDAKNNTQKQNLTKRGYWTHLVLTKYCQTGKTASGAWTYWGTVSSTFRFGTHFNIPGYSSWATALDTGSAVGPGHLDLYDPSCSRSIIFGRRYGPVFVYYR